MSEIDGASLRDRALIASDEAATRLHPSGFDPSRWVGDKYSPNLRRWLTSRNRSFFGWPTVYRDKDGIRWIGWIDDDNWFIGCRLMRCLTEGAKAGEGSFPTLAQEIEAEQDFWLRYDRLGRCALDPDHRIAFVGSETRWRTAGDERECLWCSEHGQRLNRWTETVNRQRWEPASVDRNPKGGDGTAPSRSDESATGAAGDAQS